MNFRPFSWPTPRRDGLLLLIWCMLVCVAAWLPLAAVAQVGMLLPTTTLSIGKRQIQVEIAATDASQARGLMFRTQLPTDHGMVFVYRRDTTTCFWMKNTPLPLSIAFLDSKGVILNILDMPPLSLDNYCPVAPMRYALEMEQGWFRKAGIKAGDTITGLPATD